MITPFIKIKYIFKLCFHPVNIPFLARSNSYQSISGQIVNLHAFNIKRIQKDRFFGNIFIGIIEICRQWTKKISNFVSNLYMLKACTLPENSRDF